MLDNRGLKSKFKLGLNKKETLRTITRNQNHYD